IPPADAGDLAQPAEPDLSSLLALTEEEVAQRPAEVAMMQESEAPLAAPLEFAPEPPAAPVGAQDAFEEAPAPSFADLVAEVKPTPPPAPKPEAAPIAVAKAPVSSENEEG